MNNLNAKNFLFVLSFLCFGFFSNHTMNNIKKVVKKGNISSFKRLIHLNKLNCTQKIIFNHQGDVLKSTNHYPQILLNLDADLPSRYKISENYKNFFKAAEEGDLSTIALFLEASEFDPNIRDYKNTKTNATAFHYAIWNNHTEIITLLANDSRTNLFIKDKQGHIALFYANQGIVKSLSNVFRILYQNLLTMILNHNPEKNIDYLPSNKLDINPFENPNACVCYLKNREHIKNVILTYKHLGREHLGKFILYHAVQECDFEMVLILLILGADPSDLIDIDENNFISIASFARCKLLKFILKEYSQYEINDL